MHLRKDIRNSILISLVSKWKKKITHFQTITILCKSSPDKSIRIDPCECCLIPFVLIQGENPWSPIVISFCGLTQDEVFWVLPLPSTHSLHIYAMKISFSEGIWGYKGRSLCHCISEVTKPVSHMVFRARKKDVLLS